MAAGNQSGKTFAGAREVLPQIILPIYDDRIEAVRGRRGWIVVPQYSLADPIIAELHSLLQGKLGWKRVRRSQGLGLSEYHYALDRHVFTFPYGGVDSRTGIYDESQQAKVWIKSAGDPSGLHAQPLDWILIDEAGMVPFEVYQVNLITRLTVTGGWIAAIGTFENALVGQWYVDYWRIGQRENERGIESFRHPTARLVENKETKEKKLVPVNPYVDMGWLDEQRAFMDPDLFAARYLAIPRPNEKLVFKRFNYLQNVDATLAEFDPNLPVYLGVDPGGVYAVVAFQVKFVEGLGNIIAVVDEIYDRTGGPTDRIATLVKGKPWVVNLRTLTGAIDIAAKESWQLWRRNGFLGWVRKRVRIEVGNDTLRSYIAHGRLVVHPRARGLLDEFSRYSYPDVVAGGDPRSRQPKDEFNHSIKALIYGIIGVVGYWDKAPGKRRVAKVRRKGML